VHRTGNLSTTSRGTPEGERRYGRTRHNVLGAKSLWADIDAHPDGHIKGKTVYKTTLEASRALHEFCVTTKLPAPLIVNSGYGLHPYWPLLTTLDPVTWKRCATGLQNLFNKYKLLVDPARTADISSVLRTPGTYNKKRAPWQSVYLDVRFLEEIKPYPLEAFAPLLEHADKTGTVISLSTTTAPQRKHTKPGMNEDALAGTTSYRDAYAAQIVENCAQLREMRDKKGILPEPQWHAALGVTAFCEDGDQIAHAWSSGDPRYTHEETQKRLDRLRRATTGPTTCEKFHQLNADACKACKHWGKIKSPISLGTAPATITPGWTPRWERTQGGVIKSRSYINAAIALRLEEIKFSHDVFHNRKLVDGDAAENAGPELSDAICRALRDHIIAKYGFDPGIENVQQAAERLCEANRFDPVCDYLASLQWDGIPRLDQWFTTYLGAADTELNRSIGRKMLLAAVRRIRHPGCKFDYAPVLEGQQGSGKSSALRILAGEENFTDQPILHLETRAQQEALEGVWICELSELNGLRRAETETVKNFLSKTEDSARPAYGRFYVRQPRRCIFVGTTNDNEYLRDTTGNRRFWPAQTSTIDLEALKRDRDQLWAEAALVETQDESLVIPGHLFGAASYQQEQRLMRDPWEDELADVSGTKASSGDGTEEERISSHYLMRIHLGLSADRQTDMQAKRLRNVMNRLGWQGPKKMRIGEGEKPVMGYWRPVPAEDCSTSIAKLFQGRNGASR
jgi:hypothetical protein